MLKVVSNTTPIISLLKINQLEVLQELYKEIYVPNEVFQEVEAGKSKNFYEDLSKLEWVNIVKIKDEVAVKSFIDLDAGEAEAIILASEINADLIILDEKLGRLYATNMGLRITGTIGVLIKAKQSGLLSNIRPLIDELINQGIWINEKLKHEVLKIVGEI